MKKLIIILISLAIVGFTSNKVSAQPSNVSGSYITNPEIDSIVPALFSALNSAAKLNNYRRIGMDTIHMIADGGFQVFEFTPGKKEFHGTYALDKFTVRQGNVVYFVGGTKKFSISDKNFSSDGYDLNFAKAKLQDLLQIVRANLRKK